MTTTQANPTATNLEANTILLVLRMGMLGNRRKVKTGAEGEVNVLPKEEDASLPHDGTPDQESMHVAKELLNSFELRAIGKLQFEVRDYLRARALPNFHILKGTVHRLPVGMVPEVDNRLLEYVSRQGELVDQFIQALPMRVSEARLRLGALFNPEDYPEPGAARAAFRFQFRYLTTDIPAVLGMISQGLMTRERAKVVAEISAEAEDIRLAMRQSFSDLIEHAAERLGTSQDGKKMVFKDTMVRNMEEFFALFNQRNVVGDQELAQLVEKARQAMQGVTPDDLRKAAGLRASIRDVFTNIKSEMDRNLMLRPTRRLILEDTP
ncbi:MAG: hypothetical protein U1B30_15845 [Pseudomonadota bacterium]|nr:hypothetical protein [Pseudomonadota bacterium]